MSAEKKIELIENIYALVKIFNGILLGYVVGSIDIFNETPILGILLWVLSIIMLYLLFYKIFNLKNVNTAKMLLLNGTFASFLAFTLVWGILISS